MDKKLITFSLCALLAGTLLGYTGKFLKQETASADKNASVEQTGIRPRFGDSFAPDSHRKVSAVSGPASLTAIDQKLKRLARLSPEELWKEQEKLKGLEEGFSYQRQSIEYHILSSYIFTMLGTKSPRQTLQLMEQKNPSDSWLQYGIMDVWSKKNPEAVMAYCLENKGTDAKKNRFLTHRYIAALTKLSPDKALDYVLTLPKKEQADNVYYPLSQIAGKNPEKLPEIMQKMAPAIQDSKWAAQTIALIWARHDKEAATQWINTFPEDQRNEVMGTIVGELPPEEAAQKLPSLNEKAKEKATQRIMANLWNQSPEKALDWLQSQMPEEEAAKVISNHYYSENYLDPALSDYLDQLPTGPLKDSLLVKKAEDMSPFKSEFAFMDMKMEDIFSNINKISSQEKKEQAIERTLSTWAYQVPQNVKDWVEKSDLPDKKKKEYLERCNMYIRSRGE